MRKEKIKSVLVIGQDGGKAHSRIRPTLRGLGAKQAAKTAETLSGGGA